MAYLTPCFNCAAEKPECPRRQAMSKAIKGLGITSVKFNCPDRQSKFRPGQRVEFDWRYYADDGSGEGYTTSFVGTVMHEMAGNRRFAIRVDQEGEHYDFPPSEVLRNPEFISVRPDDMRALEQPDRAICPNCAAYDDAADMERIQCWARGENVPRGCHK
jgi:hypothetical protein